MGTTLLSVNVGMPKDVSWHGKIVHTGIFKDPVAGRRRVGRLNVEGDGQGDQRDAGGEETEAPFLMGLIVDSVVTDVPKAKIATAKSTLFREQTELEGAGVRHVLKVGGDMMDSTSVPVGNGHVYGWHQIGTWARIAAPPGWTSQDTARLEADPHLRDE